MYDLDTGRLYANSKIGPFDNYQFLLICFIIYSTCFTLSFISTINSFVLLCEFIQLCTIALMIYASNKVMHINRRIENVYLRLLLLCHYAWFFFLLPYSFELDYMFIKQLLFVSEGGMMVFFIPLIVLVPKTPEFFKHLFNIILALGGIFLICSAIYFKDITTFFLEGNPSKKYVLEYFTKAFGIPLGFIMLTYPYHHKKVKIFALIVIAVNIAFALYRARRGLLFVTVSPLLISYFFVVLFSKKNQRAMLVGVLVAILLSVYGLDLYMSNQDGFFQRISERIDEDTRTPVEICFYNDFDTPYDWLVGRGLNGTYYCPGVDGNDTTGYREMIETDFLNIILKAGGIYLGILLLVLLPAIFLGLFASRNILSKAAAAWIFIWLLSLYPITAFGFTMNYLLVWVSVGICYSKKIRMMPEPLLKDFLRLH
jgi:hypothetical protein